MDVGIGVVFDPAKVVGIGVVSDAVKVVGIGEDADALKVVAIGEDEDTPKTVVVASVPCRFSLDAISTSLFIPTSFYNYYFSRSVYLNNIKQKCYHFESLMFLHQLQVGYQTLQPTLPKSLKY